MKYSLLISTLALLLVSHTGAAFAEDGLSDEAQANNPLADITAFNVQNYYISQISGLDDQNANTFWLRFAKPIGRWLFRGSLPLQRVPTGIGTTTSGVGDLDAFFAYLLKTRPTRAFGVGPQLAFPTASEDETGSGKYQGGVAAVYFNGDKPHFQWGGLVTWRGSFAGDDDRDEVNVIAAQPFYFFQLGKGYYFRGAPIWVFDLETDNYHIPMGLGVGKVMKAGNTVYNFFIEPQFTILDRGPGQPEVQLYMALNMQFK